MIRLLSTSLDWLADQARAIENRMQGWDPATDELEVRVSQLELRVGDLRTLATVFSDLDAGKYDQPAAGNVIPLQPRGGARHGRAS